jgi:hypothetical protein
MSHYGVSYSTRDRSLDTTFAEVTDPSEILRQDIESALDEAEGAFFWEPEISIEISRYRNEGITPSKLAEIEARAKGVLIVSDLIDRVTITAAFDTVNRNLFLDCDVFGVGDVGLQLQLVATETGFENVRLS